MLCRLDLALDFVLKSVFERLGNWVPWSCKHVLSCVTLSCRGQALHIAAEHRLPLARLLSFVAIAPAFGRYSCLPSAYIDEWGDGTLPRCGCITWRLTWWQRSKWTECHHVLMKPFWRFWQNQVFRSPDCHHHQCRQKVPFLSQNLRRTIEPSNLIWHGCFFLIRGGGQGGTKNSRAIRFYCAGLPAHNACSSEKANT